MLDDLKTLLMINDDKKDKVLNLIIKNTSQSLKTKIGADVPEDLEYIVTGVAVKRYNRLKNEGMNSYSQEGESITFEANDFDEFQTDIDKWVAKNNEAETQVGKKIKFLNPYKRTNL